MKTFKEFVNYPAAKTHIVIDPVTKKPIKVPKGSAVPIRSRSSASGNGDGDGGDGGDGD